MKGWAMQIGKTLYVTNRKSWRAWLVKNHKIKKEIWLVYYRKHVGKPSVSYDAAVEEALCYGWIDSTAKRIDGDRFAQRFTPRRSGSNLSDINRARIKDLIRRGRMRRVGLEAVAHAFPVTRGV